MLTFSPRKFHCHMSIASAERNTDSQLEGMFQGKAHETRASLAILKAQGREVITLAAECDNQDAKGYCLGHEGSGHESA